jgi:hypothetical protein
VLVKRLVRFWRDEAVGPSSVEEQADLVAVLTGGPYPCLKPGEVPPLDVVNDFLRAGGTGGGMNGGWRWEPFDVDRDEYEELVRELLDRGDFELVETPEWVRTWPEWYAWLSERRRGIPAMESLRLQQAASLARAEYEAAREGPDGSLTADRYLEWHRAERVASEFALPDSMLADGGAHRAAARPVADAVAQLNAAVIRGDTEGVRAWRSEVARLSRAAGEDDS